ncbi:MAG: ATP-binding protein [Deltaproteobacteria bacterium]|nr:ATP-binding protein [Deltaproteobacteria bacterium]
MSANVAGLVGARGIALYVAVAAGHFVLRRRHDPEGVLAHVPAHLPDAMERSGAPKVAPGVVGVRLACAGEPLGLLVVEKATPAARARAPAGLPLIAAAAALGLGAARSRATAARVRQNMTIAREGISSVTHLLAVKPDELLLRESDRRFPVRGLDFAKSASEARHAVEHAVRGTDAEHGALGVGFDPTLPFDPWVAVGMSDEVAARLGRHPRPVGTLGAVAIGGRVVRTRDVTKHPEFGGYPPHHPDVRSLLGVPIRIGDQSLGNIYLGDKRDAVEFSADDQALVEVLIAQAALVLQEATFRETISAQRAELTAILENAPHAILFVEAGSDRVTANRSAFELFGFPLVPEAGRHQYAPRVFRPDGTPAAFADLPSSRALAGETLRATEQVLERADGKRQPILSAAVPVRNKRGEILGAIVTMEDVTPLKELEKLREEFAAVVAHDLRGPIQAILLQVQALARDARGDEVTASRKALERIEASARRLGKMTAQLLDAAAVDLSSVALDKRRIDASASVRALIEQLTLAFGGHPILLELSEPGPAVVVDPARFDQIVQNLVENAAKYSPDGAPIVVRVAVEGGAVAIAVVDEGPGISADELPRIFDRLYRHRRAPRTKSGLGLGLYITKGLVEAQGGRISVTSEVGKGSAFTVCFPSAPREVERGEGAPAAPG